MPSLESTSRRDVLRSFRPRAVDRLRLHAQQQVASASDPKGLAPEPSLAVHAANRLMFGPRAGDVAAIEAQGYEAWLADQLAPASIDDSACNALLAALPNDTLSETPAQLYDRRSLSDYSQVIRPFNQVRHATVVRMSHSKRQLFERMVDFWHNHFNIYGLDFIVRSMWPLWDSTLRQHALGNFRVLLEATAAHPCMLYYLDNYVSTNAGPNENYAREVFELHTLGSMNYQVDGGYIDDDVYEASRCFTGWTFERTDGVAERGQFRYNHDQHDRFMKWVLGTRISNDQAPLFDGRKVLDLLAFHPGTARHIAIKLAQRFISEAPPDSIVDSTAARFLELKDDSEQIAKTLLHLLSSEEFKSARMVKFKRPADWLISMLRALDVPYSTHDSFYWDFNNMGQRFFEWPSPDGPPDTKSHWNTSNSMLQRFNYIFRLTSGYWNANGYNYTVDGVMPPELRTPREVCTFWANRVIGRPVSDTTMEGLILFIAEGRNPDIAMPATQINDKLKFLAAVCTMTPEFQMR